MHRLLLPALVLLTVLLTAAGALASPDAGGPGAEPAPDGPGIAAAASAARFTYTVERRGSVAANFGEFAAGVSGTLNDRRGWHRSNVTFRRVASGADVRIILASPSAVEAAAPVCSAQWSCRVGNQVLINDERWRTDTQAWRASLLLYRDYVVNHEVGHYLGLGHRDCPGSGQLAYVMQQQSITLGGCQENGWPRHGEVSAVASRLGTQAVSPGHNRPGIVGDPVWYTRPTITRGASNHVFGYGVNNDVPLMGDWDGDGVDTPALFYGGIWTLFRDFSGGLRGRASYGTHGDLPVVGDWDGDGDDDLGVYRDGEWHLRNGSGASGWTRYRVSYGGFTVDVPVVGDWNGDGRDGIGIYRAGEWHLRVDPSPGNGTTARPAYGWEGDVPLSGDWNGDGVDGISVYRDGQWHVRDSLARHGPTVARTGYGYSDDVPLTGDWDGDGDDEISVVRGRV